MLVRLSAIRQSGVALIMVLIIIALVTIIATQLITLRGIYSHRTQNVLLAENSWGYAVGAETLARLALHESLKNEDLVHLQQVWASQGVVFPIDGGQLSASLHDLRGCFNVNMVLASAASGTDSEQAGDSENKLVGEKIFSRLLQLIPLELDQPIEPAALAARLRDWLDEDQRPSGFDGREDEEYTGYEQAYRTGDQPLTSVSELATISGFTPALMKQLEPYVCAIPDNSDLVLNANTIPAEQPELLASFYEQLTVEEARQILSGRPGDGFTSETYQPLLPAEARLMQGASISFDSSYFAARIEVDLGTTKTRLKSLLFYDKSGSTVQLVARLGHND